MNNFHIGANIYEKILTGKPTLTLDSKFTIFAGTFPPKKLTDTIAEKGIIQRFLPFIWEVSDDILTEMRSEIAASFGTIAPAQGPPYELSEKLKKVFLKTKEQFITNGENKLKTVSYTTTAINEVKIVHDSLLDYISHLPPHIRRIVRLFEANLLEFINKIAVISCVTMNANSNSPDWKVHPTHIKQGGYLVMKCYKTLVQWLEDNLKWTSPSTTKSSYLVGFKKAYEQALSVDIIKNGDVRPPYSDEKRIGEWKTDVAALIKEGFAYKKLVLKNAEKVLGKSQESVRQYFKNIDDKFDKINIKRIVFIKPKK
jgi:hypothetical protein